MVANLISAKLCLISAKLFLIFNKNLLKFSDILERWNAADILKKKLKEVF